jgi:lactoylglutathione lyase
MQGITGFGHIAIKVKDLEKSLDFYVNKLGFEYFLDLKRDDGTVWIVYLRITDTQFLELFPGAEGDRAPGKEANGVNHLCLTIEDMPATVARMKANGITMLSEMKQGIDGNPNAWVEDPDGNRYELMEMTPGCIQAKAITALKAKLGEA